MNWNDDWRNELKETEPIIYKRLAECRNTKKDLLIIAKLMCKYNKDKTKEECLYRVVEWLVDWNSQTELLPINYSWYLQRI